MGIFGALKVLLHPNKMKVVEINGQENLPALDNPELRQRMLITEKRLFELEKTVYAMSKVEHVTDTRLQYLDLSRKQNRFLAVVQSMDRPSVPEIITRLKWPRNSVYSCLYKLIETGYVQWTGEGRNKWVLLTEKGRKPQEATPVFEAVQDNKENPEPESV